MHSLLFKFLKLKQVEEVLCTRKFFIDHKIFSRFRMILN